MKLYNPPLNAQFLRDVSLTVYASEVHGIIGTAGSGKTTLLNLIAGRCSGEISGHISLDDHPLDANRFNALCAKVSFEQRLLPSLTVKSLLNFYANLTISGLQSKDKEERILSLMQEFEILSYGHERIENLNESIRRRLILCMYLLRDPIMVLLDEPTKDIDSLSGYQLMSSLNNYMRHNQRMAIVAMRYPRSDLYQLMTRITILFYGETLYSGYTKQMPFYFRQVGYPCPNNENPAVYYLSLATIDRETSERYHETQQQATQLIHMFKQYANTQQQQQQRPSHIEPIYPTVHKPPLCVLGTPNSFSQLLTLTRRSSAVLISSWISLFTRIILLPLYAFSIVFCGVHFPHESFHIPLSMTAMYFNCISLFSVAAIFTAISCYAVMKNRMANEMEGGVTNGAIELFSLLIACFPIDFASVLSSTFVTLWLCNLASGFANYLKISLLLWCCYESSFLLTTFWMFFFRSSYKALFTSFIFCVFSLIYAGAFLRAPRSLAITNVFIHYGTYGSIFRYVTSALNNEYVSSVRVTNCSRTEHRDVDTTPPNLFCRWKNGMAYLDEIYPEDTTYTNNMLNICSAIIYVFILGPKLLAIYRQCKKVINAEGI
uniref:ATP-binding cassette sub-family G member 5 n=1 Tax=Ascaris suum TaxID=6253 RepID=F1KYZ6_ASCSU